MQQIYSVVLAGGEGTRMKSELPKVLHELNGRPMVEYVVRSVVAAGVGRIGVVVGFKGEQVKAALSGYEDIDFFFQREQRGSADALLSADAFLDTGSPLLVLCADTPLIRPETIKGLCKFHMDRGYSVSVLTARLDNPHGYGRIVKNEFGDVAGIVEERDCSDEQRLIREFNSGVYLFENNQLKELLKNITPDNSKREYYLTDAVALTVQSGGRVGSLCIDDANEIIGINSQEQLKAAESIVVKKTSCKGE